MKTKIFLLFGLFCAACVANPPLAFKSIEEVIEWGQEPSRYYSKVIDVKDSPSKIYVSLFNDGSGIAVTSVIIYETYDNNWRLALYCPFVDGLVEVKIYTNRIIFNSKYDGRFLLSIPREVRPLP